MENRQEAVAEYFRLRLMLNKANTKRNESSEIVFKIEDVNGDFILYGTLKGTSSPQRIALCLKRPRLKWQMLLHSGLYTFEGVCMNYLNKYFLEISDPTAACDMLQKELRSLGITS